MAHKYTGYDNVFPDASNQEAGMNKDKFEACEFSDSGIVSGENLQLSEEILSEDLTEQHKSPAHSQPLDKSTNIHKQEEIETEMRWDSGVGLATESFSNLSVSNPEGSNDLSSSIQQRIEPPQIAKPKEQPPWDLFYVADEDGNT